MNYELSPRVLDTYLDQSINRPTDLRIFASSHLRTLACDPPNFLTYDVEELEELPTDETGTAEVPHPDEADELSSICSGPSTPRGVHFQHSLLRQWIQVTHAHWLRRHPSHNYACRK